jgi:antitoxin (DNA-binding transcriptional repressor) of toxin-antitoxin stability system
MRVVSLKEAQSNLPSIIREMAARGESVEIIDGEQANAPVALLMPHHNATTIKDVSQSRAKGLAAIKRLRQEITDKMKGHEIRQAIEKGRL